LDVEDGGNIDDHVVFNKVSDLVVFARQYIGTTLQRKNRDDFKSLMDEEENNCSHFPSCSSFEKGY